MEGLCEDIDRNVIFFFDIVLDVFINKGLVKN